MILDADPRVTVDPWLHDDDSAETPDDLEPACLYEVHNQLDSDEEAAHYRVDDEREELWIASLVHGPADGPPILADLKAISRVGLVEKSGCGVSRMLDGEPPLGPLHLVTQLTLSRRGQAWPGRFLAGGTVSREEFEGMLASVEAALDEIKRRAEENRPPIVKVADELGLGPRPEGSSPNNWLGRCPETNHSLYLAGKEFGCGYCRRKGGADELRRFTAERRAKK